MSAPEIPVSDPVDSLLYQEVLHFYGRQMRFLDEGSVAEWAQTFTVDGIFATNAGYAPQEGRVEIEEAARKVTEQLTVDGIQRRHWLGMIQVDHGPDDTLVARSYALILGVPRGGSAAVQLSCGCEDVLVREDGALKVRHRKIRRDDLAAEPAAPSSGG